MKVYLAFCLGYMQVQTTCSPSLVLCPTCFRCYRSAVSWSWPSECWSTRMAAACNMSPLILWTLSSACRYGFNISVQLLWNELIVIRLTMLFCNCEGIFPIPLHQSNAKEYSCRQRGVKEWQGTLGEESPRWKNSVIVMCVLKCHCTFLILFSALWLPRD